MMGGDLPRKGVGALLNVAIVTAKSSNASWFRSPGPRPEAVAEVKNLAGTVVEAGRRIAWSAAQRIGRYTASTTKRAALVATEAAYAAGDSVRRTASARTESARVLAVESAHRTGKAVAEGSRLACRQAAAYVKTNVEVATEALWLKGGEAVAQVQRVILENSQRVAQAATDLAVRTFSKQKPANNEQVKASIVSARSSTMASLNKNQTTETNCQLK